MKNESIRYPAKKGGQRGLPPYQADNRILVTCPKGLPLYLKEELSGLGLPVISETVAGVETRGSLDDAMMLNLHLYTGHRVLSFVKEFSAADPDELYRKVRLVPWEEYVGETGHICITSSVDTPFIRDARFANLRCKDAIADRFNEKCGRRPDSGPERTGTVIFLHWKGTRCSLFFDTSGEPLSKRNYRKIPLKAPMQETLAAAVIRATHWRGKDNLVNPMCGSGTIAIEAALMALNRPPGLLRENFGFMHLRGFNADRWKEMREEAKNRSRRTLGGRIIATDNDGEAIEAARKNAANAGVGHLIEFGVADYGDAEIPNGGGVVIVNPEYGERLGAGEDLGEKYRSIGDFFKQRCSGYRGYIFTGNLPLAKKIGLRTKKRTQFFSGRIECRLLEYELYEGSRK